MDMVNLTNQQLSFYLKKKKKLQILIGEGNGGYRTRDVLVIEQSVWMISTVLDVPNGTNQQLSLFGM